MANRSMIIEDGWFCNGADFDCKEPYITLCHDTELNKKEKMLIPEALAYYLRTHWCGSQKMHDLIENNAIRGIQDQLKEIIGVK